MPLGLDFLSALRLAHRVSPRSPGICPNPTASAQQGPNPSYALLIEALEEQLAEYRVVDEPYHLLEDEGYEFTSPPCLEDFLEQLRRSLELLEDEEGPRNVLIDRCPLDFLGYLLTHEGSDSFDLEEWLTRVRSTIKTLDLVVFVPI
ncbi:hypothetical protein P2318_20330 [Myxococcaceae bacterium GXIMD 01537]